MGQGTESILGCQLIDEYLGTAYLQESAAVANRDVLNIVHRGNLLLPTHVLPAPDRHLGASSHTRTHSLLCDRQQQTATSGEPDGNFLQFHLLHGHLQQLHEGHL
jgi:hypothetical protein